MKHLDIGLKRLLLIDYMTQSQSLALQTHFPAHLFEKIDQAELEEKTAAEFLACNYDPATTLIVFVGQSSLELKLRLQSLINFSLFETTYVPARRIYENITITPERESYKIRADVSFIERRNFLDMSIKNIVVFDDVISTGITLKTLREKAVPYFPNAEWTSFALVSRMEKLTGYKQIHFSAYVKEKFTPINTFSKLVENTEVREKYLLKNFWKSYHGDHILSDEGKDINRWFHFLKECCIHTPHVFCFDLYNTLVYERSDALVEVSNDSGGFHSGGITVTVPDYLDYFVNEYGIKYSLTKEQVYAYVRDTLMVIKDVNFETLTQMLYKQFVPNEECTTHVVNSPANTVEWCWRARSGNAQWVGRYIPYRLKLLRSLGHKLVLITNCTYPAWMKVSKVVPYFDKCYVSSEQGVSKPNPSVWETVESWFPDFPRNKFVMIGDSEKDDLTVPRQIGWETLGADQILKGFDERIFSLEGL